MSMRMSLSMSWWCVCAGWERGPAWLGRFAPRTIPSKATARDLCGHCRGITIRAFARYDVDKIGSRTVDVCSAIVCTFIESACRSPDALMPDSTQSFTLDDLERQRILGIAGDVVVSRESFLLGEGGQQGQISKSWAPKSTQQAIDAPVFDHSYSQRFTQTQEDTSSFRVNVDNAPTIDRGDLDIANVFDVALEEQSEFGPLETSTAVPHTEVPDVPFSPPSPITDDQELEQAHPSWEAVHTPAISRLSRVQQTPGALTQMFQSSQETPVLLDRKSTYITMKDSQEQRLPQLDLDDVEDDPDFPRIRHGASYPNRASAAHSVMQRLRDRSLMGCDPPDESVAPTKTPVMSRAPSITATQDVLEDPTIPASALTITTSQHDRRGTLSDDHGSIITDSQPQAVLSVANQADFPNQLADDRVFSSQDQVPIQYNLPSDHFPDRAKSDHTLATPFQIVPLSPKVSTITDDERMEVDDIARPEPLVEQEHTLPSTTASVSQQNREPRTGQRERPILLKDTPHMIEEPCAVNLTRTEPLSARARSVRLHRSASANLTSSTTPVYTSVGTSGRSRSLYTPLHLPTVPLPELSSPILQAGDRRRSRRVPVIMESPLHARAMQPHRKRAVTSFDAISTGDSWDSNVILESAHPRKRPRLEAEIDDSQFMGPRNKESSRPAQPSLDLLSDRRSIAPNHMNGSEMSRSVTDQDSVKEIASSPLTSLDSQDFMQETSPHHLAKPGTTRWSKRILALHRQTGSYYPGDLVDCTVLDDQFHEDTIVSIKFDDTDEVDIELLHVRPLDLRIGDLVRVMVPGLKGKNLIIVALHRDEKNGTLFTDIHGSTEFTARRKDNGQTAKYSIDQVYLPPNLFKVFLKRQFTNLQKATVLDEPITPSRRHAARLRSLSSALSFKGTARSKSAGFFAGVALSVTISQSKTVSRDKIERKITNHGGLLLEDSLDSLFEDSPFSEDYDIAPLRLTVQARSLRCAIVIADNPSRKAKYLQALSLGLPCLHYSYIDDCISAKRLLDARPYLLAAGEARIAGVSVVLSMTCPSIDFSLPSPFPPTTTTTRGPSPLGLGGAMEHRRRVLLDKNVIVVTHGPDRQAARRIHFFLSWAMGCRDLTECASLEDAHHLLLRPEDGKVWDLVNVQDLEGDAASPAIRACLDDLVGRVMTNEDVVQSLISGRLVISH